MTTSMKKTLFVSLVTFVTLVAAIGVIYVVRKPSLPKTLTESPAPTAIASNPNKAQTAPILAVDPVAACALKFIVPCTSPSPSPSGSPTPSPSPSPSLPAQASLDCVAKRMYVDDSRNRAGFYYLENQIADANTIQDGQIIVYNVLARNNGGNSAPDTTVTDTLSNNLTYIDGDTSCSYNSATRVVTCTIGTLSGVSEAGRSFRARVSLSAGNSRTSVANTAEVSSTNGQRDTCSVNIDVTGKVIIPPSTAPSSLPVAGVFEVTAGTLGIGVLLLVAGALGLLLI